jgi:hypothetical protein
MTDLSVCAGCGRPYDGDACWNINYVRGRAVQLLCPDCQTPEEAEEAEEHARTIDYSQTKQVGSARLVSTDELRAANAIAAERGAPGLTDEAMAMLPEGDEHLLVLGGEFQSEPVGIAACLCSIAYEEGETVEGLAVLENIAVRAVAEDETSEPKPIRGVIEVRLPDFMGWREVLIPADLAQVLTESVQEYVRDITKTVRTPKPKGKRAKRRRRR